MLRKLRNQRKGQNTAEYAILIALVIAAVIAMQTYAKRALQAKIRDAVVYMKTQTNELGNSIQYEPYYLQSNFDVVRNQETSMVQGLNLSGTNGATNVTRTGTQNLTYSNADINSTR